MMLIVEAVGINIGVRVERFGGSGKGERNEQQRDGHW